MNALLSGKLRWLLGVAVIVPGAVALIGSAHQRLAATMALAVVLPLVSRKSEPPTSQCCLPTPAAPGQGVLWEAEPSTFRFRTVNGDMQRTLGYPAERWLKDPNFWSSHIAPEDRDRVLESCQRALASGLDSFQLEYLASASGGARVRVENFVEVVRDTEGHIRRVRGRMVNVAGQPGASEVLRQSRKMEEVGRLAGGVAHDFNNLLTVIGGHADLLLASLDPHDPRRPSVEEIKKAGERAASLTRQLLAFSRQRAAAKVPFDLNALIEGVGSMLRRLTGEDVELVIHARHGLSPILADPGQVERVIFNLVVNARDAMPLGGRVTIETAECELTAGGWPAEALPGKYIRLSVTDNGCGMDADTQSRIFDAFFTTKEAGKGTGLGLATVREIVRDCGGAVEVKSRVGLGSRFEVYFPSAEGRGEAGLAAAPVVSANGGVETVLVVEDDDNVRAMACQILKAFGYRVSAAASGEEAGRLADRHPGPVHLLLADVVLPQMNGPRLAEVLRARRPDLKVLFMSGYSRDAIQQRADFGPDLSYIQKPFTREMLGVAVRRVLDGRPEPPSQQTA